MCWARKGQGALLIRLIFALTAPEDKVTREQRQFQAHFMSCRKLFPIWAHIEALEWPGHSACDTC